MNRRLLTKTAPLVAASIVAAATLSLSFAGVAAAEVTVDFPSAEFLTTVQPVYYENHAVYWWHNRWFWRDGSSWRS